MDHLFDLTGKVALVTGGNGGIGLGMAEGLAKHGASVVIWGTNASKNEAAVAQLSAHGSTVRAAIVDVADEAAVKEGMANILSEFGRIDQAIANAGIGQSKRDMFDISIDDFKKLESINVHGVFATLREAARHMIDRGAAGDRGGSLVGIASTAAVHGAARNEHYGATKGAVVSMCRAMAVELARHAITVNAILPGSVNGPRIDKVFADEALAKGMTPAAVRAGYEQGTALRSLVDAADVANMAVFLSSDGARLVSGQAITVDGFTINPDPQV